MFVKPRSAFVGWPSVVCSSSGSAKNARYARLLPSTRKSSESRAGPSSRTSSSPVSVLGLTAQPLSLPRGPMRPASLRLRSPGSRIVQPCPRSARGATCLLPAHRPATAAPSGTVVDVAAAVRDAARVPARRRRAARRQRRGAARARASTIVVEPPALPSPAHSVDPRPTALATVLEMLERLGVPDENVTLLVAGGLARRAGRKELERLLPPPQAREFHGPCLVHDAAAPDLVPLADEVRINPAVVDADLVLVVSSAETRRPRRARSAARRLRRGDGAARRGRALARAGVGRAGLAAACSPSRPPSRHASALLGVSLVLDHPRLTGRFRGYPHEAACARARRRARRSGASTRCCRQPYVAASSDDQSRTLAATAAFAGPPSVAHAEALVRTIELRGTRLDEPLDALVLGVPWIGAHLPREPLNPITSAAIALGHALRQWRDAFPVREGGTLVLVHSLTRSFAHGTQAPYRVLFDELARGWPARGRRERCRVGRARPRRLSRGTRVPPAAPVRGLGGLPAGALPPRTRHRGREPRRGRRASTRIRAQPLHAERARDGARRRGQRRARGRPARAAVRAAAGR